MTTVRQTFAVPYAFDVHLTRDVFAPDNDIEFNPDGYVCNFEFELRHSVHPELSKKDKDVVDFGMSWYKEAAQDLFAELTAKK